MSLCIWKRNIKPLLQSNHLHLHLGDYADDFTQSDLQEVHLLDEGETIYRSRYSKGVHRTRCKALGKPIPRTQQRYPRMFRSISCMGSCVNRIT